MPYTTPINRLGLRLHQRHQLHAWAACGLIVALLLLSSGATLQAIERNDRDQYYAIRNNAIQHNNLGLTLMHEGRYLEAAEAFKTALSINPYTAMSASMFNNLGLTYRKLNQPVFALACFQHAIRIQPNYDLYFQNLVDTYAAMGDLGEAQALLSQVVTVNPDDAEALYILGLLAENAGDTLGAKEFFKKFLALKPHADLALAAKTHLD